MRLFLRSQVILLLGCGCVWLALSPSALSEPSGSQSTEKSAKSAQASSDPQNSAPAETPISPSSDASLPAEYITIPGPVRSFLRMAGISQEVSPEEVLPLFGHFVETYGFEGSKEKSPKATEALLIFRRYFVQANTLASLAGPEATLHFSTCEGSRQLLADLGYKLENGCDKIPSIEVDDPEKAFITVDSGFPLADLEIDLQQGKPFSTPYPSTRVPLIYGKSDWTGKPNSLDIDVVDVLANDAAKARLYWGLSRIDENTRRVLLQNGGVARMLPGASVLDFYGSSIAVRDGRVAVPGGSEAEQAWKKLAGADPNNPGAFVYALISKDGGWLAEYYDAIARAPQRQLQYFTTDGRLQRFYEAFHGNDTSTDSVRSIFRPGADLLILTTRLPLDDQGEPVIPGNLTAWRYAFRGKDQPKPERDIARRAERWSSPDQFLDAMFALARFNLTGGPLEMYQTLSEVDRNRTGDDRLTPETTRLLIERYATLRDQYGKFAEFSGLDNASITLFVRETEKIDAIHDPLLRADTMGIFESNVGLWQIFARQGQIPDSALNESWRQTIEPFAAFSAASQLFDATRSSLAALMNTVSGNPAITQEKIIDLLAGPDEPTPDARQVHERLSNEINAVVTDQRLVSLDTLLELGDDFARLTKTPNGVDAQRAQEMAEELEEARSPRAMFTESERAEWAPGHEPNRHVMLEMRTDLRKSISGTEPPKEASEMRGALTPFLRDTLVGLNYAYYEPPGAEILHNSPLLVREHDFLASEAVGQNRAWQAPELFGIGLTAGNGTHLSGSLAGLPYALAEIEQDFIVPENVQALIWHDTAADLLTTSVVPRWWSTSQDALHAVALYQEAGEELVKAAAKDTNLRPDVIAILGTRMSPENVDRVNAALTAGDAARAMTRVSPEDTLYLTSQFRQKYPDRTGVWGPAGTELEALAKRDPSQVSIEVLSKDFGVPHPTLSQSYRGELLDLRPFPSVMDYASELLAESWESTNLYWARLADEMGYTPAMLNELAPILTRRMVEEIFGSDFDDWPALNRAMRQTGDEFRRGQVAGIPKINMPLQP
jgi:hypothetical protein